MNSSFADSPVVIDGVGAQVDPPVIEAVVTVDAALRDPQRSSGADDASERRADASFVVTDVAVEQVGANLAAIASVAADDLIVAGTAMNFVGISAAPNLVDSVLAIDGIRAAFADYCVVASTAVDRVGAVASFDSILAVIPLEKVVAVATVDCVVADEPWIESSPSPPSRTSLPSLPNMTSSSPWP